MARTMWVSDAGTSHEEEIDAIRADVVFWKKRADELQAKLTKSDARADSAADRLFHAGVTQNPRSSYGSSGGGGHD